MSAPRHFVMAGGGTGGHIIPALAVAQEMKSRGHEITFIGTHHGLESKLVPKAGFPIEWIEIGGLNRVDFTQRLRTLGQLPLSTMRVRTLFRRLKPAAVFSMGGYVAGPVVLAAWLAGVPVVAMEPNAVPGMVNRRMARFVSKALIHFPETASYFPSGTAEVVGMPVREPFFHIPPRTPLVDGPFTLLITGGSQGSRTLNNASRDSWQLFASSSRALSLKIIHQTGLDAYAGLEPEFRQRGLNGEVTAFIDDMPAAFAQADLILCRSGASTVAEIAAAGKPAILVPFPFAADDHQRRNAEALANAGAARVILDKDLTGKRLYDEVTALAADRVALQQLADAVRAFAHPDAARKAADALESSAR